MYLVNINDKLLVTIMNLSRSVKHGDLISIISDDKTHYDKIGFFTNNLAKKVSIDILRYLFETYNKERYDRFNGSELIEFLEKVYRKEIEENNGKIFFDEKSSFCKLINRAGYIMPMPDANLARLADSILAFVRGSPEPDFFYISYCAADIVEILGGDRDKEYERQGFSLIELLKSKESLFLL